MPPTASPSVGKTVAKKSDHKSGTLNGHTNGKSSIGQNGNSTAGNGAAGNGKNDWQILWISVDRIDPNPFQPRLSFDELEMQELIASVRSKGVQQPILVRTSKADKAIQNSAASNRKTDVHKSNGKPVITPPRPALLRYELVAGERRLRACKTAGKRWIPAIVRDDLSDAEAAELAILENVQRSNISVIEEARGYKRLMLEFRLKEERLAKKVGKSVGTIREMMKLLQLPEAVQILLFEKKLTAAHGHALLPLAPFEKACSSVAQYAVREKLTATSLEAALLPNAKVLKGLGLLVELDFKTKFDWQSECGQCPFKAYVRSGYNSYCLLPEEWMKKQSAALARQDEEATQVMEQARQDNSGVVEVEHLTPGSYKDLSFGDPPAGCNVQCPCYKEVEDALDPTRKRPVCLDPNRYKGLVQAEREAEENARRVKFNALWESAKEKLLADEGHNDLRRVTALIALPILRSMYDEHGYIESWRQGVEQIAEELGVSILDDFLNADTESEAYAALDAAMQNGCEPSRVLLLCALLMLASEARTAVRFIRETPGLDYVMGNKQHSLEPSDAASNSAESDSAQAPDLDHNSDQVDDPTAGLDEELRPGSENEAISEATIPGEAIPVEAA